MKELHSFIEIYFFGVLLTHIVISNQENVGLHDSQQYHHAGSHRNITKVQNDNFKQTPLEWTHHPFSGVYSSRKELSEPWYINSNSYIVHPRKGRQILYNEENIDMQYTINKFSQAASAHCPYADFCFINGSKINSKSTTLTSCCKACYCDSKCGERMDCCFDGLDQDKIVKTHQMVCVLPRIGGDTFWAKSYRSFYMVVTCPDNSTLYHENKTSPFDQLYPVYSRSADMIFLNREYAECNGLFDSLNFTSYMTCREDAWTFDSLSLKDLKINKCELTFFPPENIAVDKFACYYGLIDSCNVTGEWTDYDDDIRQACESIRAPVYFGKIYANVFCKLCNGKRHNPLKICDVDDWYESITRTSGKHFVALLDYQSLLESITPMDDVLLENKKCGKHEVLHPNKRECRKVLCPNSAVRTAEGCKTFLKTWQKEGYTISVVLTPANNELIPVASLWNLARVQQRNHKFWFDSAGIPVDNFAMDANLVEQNNVSYVKRLEVMLGSRHGPVYVNDTLHVVALAMSRNWILRLNKNKVYMYHAVFAKYKQISIHQSYRKLEDYQRRQNSSQAENVWLTIMRQLYFDTLSINKMQFCEQVELNPGEWNVVKIMEEIKLNLTSTSDEKILGNAEFNLLGSSEGDRVWICVEDFNKDYYTSHAYKPNTSFIFLTIMAVLRSVWHLPAGNEVLNQH